MNRKHSALALTFFAMGALALTAPEASARLKDPDRGYTSCTYPENPTCNTPPLEAMTTTSSTTSSTSSDFQPAQLGASALGGAGAAFAGMWLYRRRHELAN